MGSKQTNDSVFTIFLSQVVESRWPEPPQPATTLALPGTPKLPDSRRMDTWPNRGPWDTHPGSVSSDWLLPAVNTVNVTLIVTQTS